jgi:hypothetical protein
MRLNELKPNTSINLEKDSPNTDWNKAVKYINGQCSDILSLYRKNHKVLYRGITRHAGLFIGHPGENRPSFGGNPDLMKVVDEKLIEGGFKALRSNSIMCTSRKSRAMVFGTPYVIFPKNGFDFTYSLIIKDLNTFAIDTPFNNSPESKVAHFKNLPSMQMIWKYGFRNTYLLDGMKNSNEIYIKGDYLAVSMYVYENQLIELLGNFKSE